MITFGERGETVKEFSVGIKDRLRQLDFIILICAVGMSVLSVMILWGCSELVGSRRMIVQSAAAFLGLIVMVSVSLVDYDAILSPLLDPPFRHLCCSPPPPSSFSVPQTTWETKAGSTFPE